MSGRRRGAALMLGVLAHGTESAAQESRPLRMVQLDTDSSGDLTETITPGTTAPNDADVTETIGTPSAETPPAPTTEASQPAASDPRIVFGGYVRESLELNYGELAREGGDAPAPALWRDIFTSHTQLVLRASYLQPRHFEATISGVLGYTVHVAQGAPQYSVGVVDLVRGEVDPELREAYLGFFWPGVDLRIGQQRVAWGKADFQSPNDVINARDLRDPFLNETELRYLPTPVMRASATAGAVTFEAVGSPFFVPDRYDVYGSNWSVLQEGRSPPTYRAFVGNVGTLVDSSVEREFATLWRQTERPKDNGKGISAGARISASLSGTDLDAYYQYGFDSLPFVQLDSRFTGYLNDTYGDPTLTPTTYSEKFTPLLQLVDEGVVPISSRYLRRHHVGFDVATTFGSFALRVDAAYQTQRVFYFQQDLTSFASPTLLGVLSLEYQTGSLDDVILVEFMGAHLVDKPPQPLLAYERNTAAIAGTLRWSLGESWGIDLRGLVGITPRTAALQPALRFKPNDSFSLRLGALVMSGAPGSFGWYYGDNDTAFVQLRYAF
jgi:hypothetical protein